MPPEFVGVWTRLSDGHVIELGDTFPETETLVDTSYDWDEGLTLITVNRTLSDGFCNYCFIFRSFAERVIEMGERTCSSPSDTDEPCEHWKEVEYQMLVRKESGNKGSLKNCPADTFDWSVSTKLTYSERLGNGKMSEVCTNDGKTPAQRVTCPPDPSAPHPDFTLNLGSCRNVPELSRREEFVREESCEARFEVNAEEYLITSGREFTGDGNGNGEWTEILKCYRVNRIESKERWRLVRYTEVLLEADINDCGRVTRDNALKIITVELNEDQEYGRRDESLDFRMKATNPRRSSFQPDLLKLSGRSKGEIYSGGWLSKRFTVDHTFDRDSLGYLALLRSVETCKPVYHCVDAFRDISDGDEIKFRMVVSKAVEYNANLTAMCDYEMTIEHRHRRRREHWVIPEDEVLWDGEVTKSDEVIEVEDQSVPRDLRLEAKIARLMEGIEEANGEMLSSVKETITGLVKELRDKSGGDW